eukprot:m.422544 g.422544  ORF g.422544 m.422544 type:complete len:342 (-) comp37907_c0_seq1:205-1230(-)
MSEVVEYATITRILKERGGPTASKSKGKGKGKGKRQKQKRQHEFLCGWLDGAPAQWVAASDLEGSMALEQWVEAEEVVPEVHDPPERVADMCATLAGWLKTAKRPVFLLGAGISAPVLPTFRGKGGLWTKEAGDHVPIDAPVRGAHPTPTMAHRGLVALEHAGFVYHAVTQNYDDLSYRSGFPPEKMAELHGNIFTEKCDVCSCTYHRDFEVELPTSTNHETGRECSAPDCGGALRDTIVHFGEALPWHELKMANAKCVGADLTIVLGSSLRVEPAASLPFKSKRWSRFGQPHAVIVNLQPTPADAEADLVIRSTCDHVVHAMASALIGPDWDAASNTLQP